MTTASLKNFLSRHKFLLPDLIVIVFSFVLYGNTIMFDYAFDDAVVVQYNVFTQKGIKGIPEIFSYDTFVGSTLNQLPDRDADEVQANMKELAGGRYRPLSVAMLALEVEIFGSNRPHISHFINILLYIITAMTLYRLLVYLFNIKYGEKSTEKWYFSVPFIAVLLFLAHPLHTEVVANIKSRDEIMALLGVVLTTKYTFRYLDRNKIWYLFVSFFWMLFGVFSKENAVTFIALIPLTVYYFSDYSIKRNLITVIPMFVACVIFFVVRGWAVGFYFSKEETVPLLLNDPFLYASPSGKYATIFYTLWIYIKLLIFPHPLTWDYYPCHIPIIGVWDVRAILPFLLYLAMGIYALYGLIKKRDLLSYCIWAYLIPLSIVSNLFFVIGAFMAERFAFISSIAFCIMLAWLIVEKIPSWTKKPLVVPMKVLIAVILSLYTYKTVTRNEVWRDNVELFSKDVNPNSIKSTLHAGGAYLGIATSPGIMYNAEEHNKNCLIAKKWLERCIELDPTMADAHRDLGRAWEELDYGVHVIEALSNYRVALVYCPDQNNRDIVKYKIQNTVNQLLLTNMLKDYPLDALMNELDMINAIAPDIAEVYYCQAVVLGQIQKRDEEAIGKFNRALQYGYADTTSLYYNMAVSYRHLKDYDSAIKYLMMADECTPDNPQVLHAISVTYSDMGNEEKAVEYDVKLRNLQFANKVNVPYLLGNDEEG